MVPELICLDIRKLDYAEYSQIRRSIQDLGSEGIQEIVFDMRQILSVDSASIGFLISLVSTAQSLSVQLFSRNLNPQVEVLFEQTRLNNLIRPFEDSE